MFGAALIGSYPRSERVASIHRKLLKGVIGVEEFERLIGTETEKLLKLFVRAGLDAFTDGMLRWDDIFNPLIRFVDGVEVDGLVRFYDNNFFFRAPVIKSDPIVKDNAPIVAWCRRAAEVLERLGVKGQVTLKQSLPGPATIASASIANGVGVEELIEKWWSGVLEPLAKEMIREGCIPEFHEPEVVWDPSRKDLWVKAADLVSKVGKGWYVTYFRPANPVVEVLARLGESFVVVVDIVSGTNVDRVVGSGIRRLGLGAVDARNTKMEKCRGLVSLARKVAEGGAEEVFVTNNTLLDFLPEPVARKKVRLLGRVRKRLVRGSGV